MIPLILGLQNARDTYMRQLAELQQQRPRPDDTLLNNLRRLDAELMVAKDALVGLKVVSS